MTTVTATRDGHEIQTSQATDRLFAGLSIAVLIVGLFGVALAAYLSTTSLHAFCQKLVSSLSLKQGFLMIGLPIRIVGIVAVGAILAFKLYKLAVDVKNTHDKRKKKADLFDPYDSKGEWLNTIKTFRPTLKQIALSALIFSFLTAFSFGAGFGLQQISDVSQIFSHKINLWQGILIFGGGATTLNLLGILGLWNFLKTKNKAKAEGIEKKPIELSYAVALAGGDKNLEICGDEDT